MASPASRNVLNYKLVLLGETNVGKSCIASRFARNEFFEFQEPTIGVNLNDVTIKFEIWDTAGQERYKSLAPMYYRGAKAALVVYDMTLESSFHAAKQWVAELRRRGDPDVVIALAGNKCDLREQQNVNTDEAREYANEQHLIFMECSALSAENINELFVSIAKKLPKIQAPADESLTDLDKEAERNSKCCK